jgi:paraquat-inducible protein A
MKIIRAADKNLALCKACHQLTPCEADQTVACQRCGATVSLRMPHSIERTWAFLIAAMVTLIPANVLPMMTILLFGHGQPSTIMGGVIELVEYKMYPIAAVIFIASFMVPFFKIFSLMTLLIKVQRDNKLTAQQCTRLYRIVEFLGRWSMLDVYVVTLMIAIVQLGSLASIVGGAGVAAFGCSVILTMIASHSFDPRLIWDKQISSETPDNTSSEQSPIQPPHQPLHLTERHEQ